MEGPAPRVSDMCVCVCVFVLMCCYASVFRLPPHYLYGATSGDEETRAGADEGDEGDAGGASPPPNAAAMFSSSSSSSSSSKRAHTPWPLHVRVITSFGPGIVRGYNRTTRMHQVELLGSGGGGVIGTAYLRESSIVGAEELSPAALDVTD